MDKLIKSTRGEYKQILSHYMFLNDNEIGSIEFYYSIKARARLYIEFEPMNNPLLHPPIEITGTKPNMKMKLIGWNSQRSYSAIKPLKLFDLSDSTAIFFSICNSYMGGTNLLYIELYTTEK